MYVNVANLTIETFKNLINSDRVSFQEDKVVIFSFENEICYYSYENFVKNVFYKYEGNNNFSKLRYYYCDLMEFQNYCIYNDTDIFVCKVYNNTTFTEEFSSSVQTHYIYKNFFASTIKQLFCIQRITIILKHNGSLYIISHNNTLKYVSLKEKIKYIRPIQERCICVTESNNLYYLTFSFFDIHQKIYINVITNNDQKGGSINDSYKKYLKYKHKYLKLKKMLNNYL